MTETQTDLVAFAIFMVIMIPLTLYFEAEIWAAMDWILTTTENFNGR